jgi:hypothetical protein
MRYLKQNTATRITVGPFLDVTDGVTPETGLTATNEHCTLVIDNAGVPTLILDANLTASEGTNDFVHVTNDDAGMYDLELTAAQTNYVGRAILSINYVTDHCPVFHEFTILPANVYDSMLGADYLQVDMIEIEGSDATDSLATEESISTQLQTDMQADPTQFHVNVMEINGTAQTANDNGADINSILADTNELQTDLTNGGRLDLLIDELTAQGDTNESKLDAIPDDVVTLINSEEPNVTATGVTLSSAAITELAAAIAGAGLGTIITSKLLAFGK